MSKWRSRRSPSSIRWMSIRPKAPRPRPGSLSTSSRRSWAISAARAYSVATRRFSSARAGSAISATSPPTSSASAEPLVRTRATRPPRIRESAAAIAVARRVPSRKLERRAGHPEAVPHGHHARIAATAAFMVLPDGELERASGALLGRDAEAAERLARLQAMHGLEDEIDRLGLARCGRCGRGGEREPYGERRAHHAALVLAI